MDNTATRIALTTSLGIVVFCSGVIVGHFFTPEYKQTMYAPSTMQLGLADGLVDLRYLNAMIAHHRGAVLLAQQLESRTTRPELQELAAEIQKNEPVLIAELLEWKKEWYSDYRPVRDPSVAQLGAADAKVDLRFLNALIAHHEAGIVMTQEIKTKTSRAEVLNNADAVESFLKESSGVLKQRRKEWFGI